MFFRDSRRTSVKFSYLGCQLRLCMSVLFDIPTRIAGTLVNMTSYPSFPAFCFDMVFYLGVSLSTQLISMFGAAGFLPIFAKRVAIDNPQRVPARLCLTVLCSYWIRPVQLTDGATTSIRSLDMSCHVLSIAFLLTYVCDRAHQRVPPCELITTCVLTQAETLTLLVLQPLDFYFLRRLSFFNSCVLQAGRVSAISIIPL